MSAEQPTVTVHVSGLDRVNEAIRRIGERLDALTRTQIRAGASAGAIYGAFAAARQAMPPPADPLRPQDYASVADRVRDDIIRGMQAREDEAMATPRDSFEGVLRRASEVNAPVSDHSTYTAPLTLEAVREALRAPYHATQVQAPERILPRYDWNWATTSPLMGLPPERPLSDAEVQAAWAAIQRRTAAAEAPDAQEPTPSIGPRAIRLRNEEE